jgi:hypothetical protein
MPRYGRFGALEYTTAGDGARLAMLVMHDDAKREYAYGPAADCRTRRSEFSVRQIQVKLHRIYAVQRDVGISITRA